MNRHFLVSSSTSAFLMAVVLSAPGFVAAQSSGAAAKTDAKASKATVYVYRYKQFVGSALSPSVWCDETELARMENGRYFTVTLDPGKHNFSSNDKQSGIELDAKAGQEYFVRVEIATGMMKGHGRLLLVARSDLARPPCPPGHPAARRPPPSLSRSAAG